MRRMRHAGAYLTLTFAALVASTFSGIVHASATSEDTGTITVLWVDATGSVAVQLNSGFPNAVAAQQCGTYNGDAGNTTADPALKAALLAAKLTGQPIHVVTQGCDASGAWIKIIAAYLE